LLDDRASKLDDLYAISLDAILEFLRKVGDRLDLDRNPHWREAFEVSCRASNLSRPVLERVYRNCAEELQPARVREIIDLRIGSQYLEDWVPHKYQADGRTFYVRAMGARAVHIIAGNVPIVAVLTMMRNAFTRSDAIVKLPSNDPMTMIALARTMIDIDPKHPLTRHLSVGYWKGGDENIEKEIYQPSHIEKIVAWGGFASIKHITKYLQPGIDLVTLDPKNSTTLIGREAFADDVTMREVATRVAVDLGGLDQEGCVNARIMFIESGTDPEGIAAANRFGQCLYDALQGLPKSISSGPVRFDPALRNEIEAILPLTDFYRVYCDPRNIDKSGAVIVSQMSEQVDFPRLLYGRVGNLVPVDHIEEVVERFTAATQTVGVYPDALRVKLRTRAALRGGQMFVPVGYAISGNIAAPQDGIEPERRMCRWVVDNHCDPGVTRGPWLPEP
jgi:Acyl-CoA reductase (LuxC)